MKKLLLSIFALTFFISHSQPADIDVISEKTETGFTMKAINNTDVPREFTVTLDVHNLKGYTKPIVKLVPPNSTVKVIDLTKTPNEYNNLKWKFSHKAKPKVKAKKVAKNDSEEDVMDDLGVSDKGIYMFVKEGCQRCKLASSKLTESNVDFEEINVTKDPNANKLMWKLLRLKDPTIKRISQPVFLVDGKLSHDIDDLKSFVFKLIEK